MTSRETGMALNIIVLLSRSSRYVNLCFYLCFCSSICPATKKCRASYGDGVCDPECNSAACGFDGGDCQAPVAVPDANDDDGVADDAEGGGTAADGVFADPQSPTVSPTTSPGYLSIILSANRTTYALEERPILAQLASLLHGVVRVAIDEHDQPLIIDMDGGKSIRVSLLPLIFALLVFASTSI